MFIAEVDWGVLGGNIIQAVLVVFGPILALLATWAAAKLAKKWGIEATAALNQAVADAALNAVHYAEHWAEKATKDADGKVKPTGNEKLDKAVEFATAALGNAAVQKYGIEPLRDMIESKLKASINSDSGGV